jgi:hypothetical protein
MVKALLAGNKTQTRRIVNPQPVVDPNSAYTYFKGHKYIFDIHTWKSDIFRHAPVHVYDVLWVREAFYHIEDSVLPQFAFKADYHENFNFKNIKWKPSIHMPYKAARLFYKVVRVGIQQVGEISEHDAEWEGVEYNESLGGWKNYLTDDYLFGTARESFNSLWQKINGPQSWNANPYVWVYEFEQVDKPKQFFKQPC